MNRAVENATAVAARPGPGVDRDGVYFRVPDADRRLAAVRLWQEVRVPGDQLDFRWCAGTWTLRLPRPAVDRMEYLVELVHGDGRRETVLDPTNPQRVAGVFGDHSVLELPGYVPPAWLSVDAPPGRSVSSEVTTAALNRPVAVRLWSPAGLGDDQPAPLLVAHDGPEYDALSQLTRFLAAAASTGDIPPVRCALLDPGPRDTWYSANRSYARALALGVLPTLQDARPTTSVIGMGASLGALAWLHVQRRHPSVVDGLFLQSGSFFHPRFDAHERRFRWYPRIERFVDQTLRADGHPTPVPVVLTCGGIEENVENNRVMARALSAQGYDAELVEVRDVHSYTAWRDSLDPLLSGLLRRLTT